MKTKLLHLWDGLTSTYWFVPTGMSLAAAGVAVGMLWVDRNWITAPQKLTWIYTGGPDGARALLSTVAGSVITVAGVVFSITIATLTQASSQFGPRLLRNFIRDTGNQTVLGTFLATFIYSLLVLRSIRGQEDASFVPNASITVAVLMAAGSIAVLIYFIHHVSQSLQAPLVVAAVGHELERAVRHAFPRDLGHDRPEGNGGAKEAGEAGGSNGSPAEGRHGAPEARAADSVDSEKSGYVQAVDQEALMELAQRHDLVLRLHRRPGDYVIRGMPLLRLEAGGPRTDALEGALRGVFILGRQRTAEQDPEFAVRQLVEIAVRALSPGINDPFTAMNCIDWLGAALCAAAREGLPGPRRYDGHGKLRVVAKVTDFAGLADAALHQVRQYGADSVAVTLRLLEVIAEVARQLRTDAQRHVLLRHAELVIAQGRRAVPAGADRDEIEQRYEAAAAALRGAPAPAPAPAAIADRAAAGECHE